MFGEKNRLLSLDKDKLSQDEIITSGTKPIASILDKMPGVGSLKTGFTIAKPMIQGMYGSRVIVLNNGIKQEGQQWGQEHGLEIDAYNAALITLVKGAEALQYTGDAVGGILLVQPMAFSSTDTLLMSLTMAGTVNGRQGNLSASLEKTITSRRLGRVGYRFQGTLKRAGNLNTPKYYLLNTGFAEQSASMAIQLIDTKKHKLDLFSSFYHNKPGILASSHIGNLTDLIRAINNEKLPEEGSFTYQIDRPYQEILHWLIKSKWKWQMTPTMNFEVIYGFQLNKRNEYDSHNYFNKTTASLDFTLQTHQIDLVLNKNFQKGLIFKTGLNGYGQTNNYIGRYFIPNYRRIELYQFSILRYKKNRHEFEIGYRLGAIKLDVYKWEANVIEHYPFFYRGLSWQAGWLFNVSHDWQVAMQLGKVWRNPNISEMFSEGLHHGAAAIEYGDLNLKPESAISGNLIVRYRHNRTVFEAELFVKEVKNYIYLKPKFPPELTIRGAFPAFQYVQTNALFTGIDFYLDQQLFLNFSFIEKMSLLNVYDQNEPEYIVGIPPYRFDHAIVYKIPNNMVFKNAKFKVSLQQVLEQTRYTLGTDYSPPPKGYSILNFSFTTNFSKPKNILFFLSMDNVLNLRYRNYLNRFRYYADEVGRMTSVGINIKF